MQNNTFLRLKKTETAVAAAYLKWKDELSPQARYAHTLFCSSMKTVSRSHRQQFEEDEMAKFSKDCKLAEAKESPNMVGVLTKLGNLVSANLERINCNVCLSIRAVTSKSSSIDFFVLNDGADDFGQSLILFEISSNAIKAKLSKNHLEKFLLNFLSGHTRISYGENGVDVMAVPNSGNDKIRTVILNTVIAYSLTRLVLEHFEADCSMQMEAS